MKKYKGIELFQSMDEILSRDVEYWIRYLKRDDNQFVRRSLIRATFSFFEGIIFSMKHEIILEASKINIELSEAELMALKEVSYELNRTGMLHSKSKFLPFLYNMRFTFSEFIRYFL